MKANYAPFIDRVINRYEGLYGWDRHDPGGPTKYGVTCYDLAEHRHQRMDSMEHWAPLVRAMSLSEAEDIYAQKYASGVRFDDLPSGVDCVVLDYAINSGISRAARVACTLAGSPGEVITTKVVGLINMMDQRTFINKMCDERLKFMHAIRGGAAWAQFGRGWGNRVLDLRNYSLHIAAGRTAMTAPDVAVFPGPKATNTPTRSGASSIGGSVVAGAGAHAAGISGLGVLAIILGVAGAGIAYELYSMHITTLANNTVHA